MNIIQNFSKLASTKDREIVLRIVEKGIKSVLPEEVIQKNLNILGNILRVKDKEFDLDKFKRIFVVGFGKASGRMAQKINEIFKQRIKKGFVNSTEDFATGNIIINKAGHPLPDQKGMEGANKILSIKPQKDDLVLCLISGGGSTMFPCPVEGISLEDLINTNKLLLLAGANIYEINSIRKHLSKVKGGKLAARFFPATVISLILSDVLGDDLSVIASGPTAPDSSTFKDAVSTLEKYQLVDKVPKVVLNYLKGGMEGKYAETIKNKDKVFNKVYNFIVANNSTALENMAKKAKNYGLKTYIIDREISGEAKEVAKFISQKILESSKRSALIFGGEPTVTVKGKGKGGRNQELMLSMIEYLNGKNITVASVNTDGIDFSEVAGAIIDGTSFKRATELKLNIKEYLKNNDSFHFFEKLKDHIITGYTGTNVGDIIIGVKQYGNIY